MERIVNSSDVHKDMETLFKMLNKDFFDGVLDVPTINLVPTSKEGFVRYNPDTEWIIQNKVVHQSEVNISTGILELPIENVCAEILHVMCHMKNAKLEVKDTSRGGTYHNKNFLKEAKRSGLNVVRTSKYGYSVTCPSERVVQWCMRKGLKNLKIYRNTAITDYQQTYNKSNLLSNAVCVCNSNSHHVKYMCPRCGWSCRATSIGRLICLGKKGKEHDGVEMVLQKTSIKD